VRLADGWLRCQKPVARQTLVDTAVMTNGYPSVAAVDSHGRPGSPVATRRRLPSRRKALVVGLLLTTWMLALPGLANAQRGATAGGGLSQAREPMERDL
jgi:hypothetical protein